jgi:enamine deaminase RidA (YjgF/YER057c/UK114 family)
MPGLLGRELTLAQGREAAALAALTSLARIHEALGGFERLRRILRVDGFVASTDDFLEQPAVLDGASEVFNVALAERGRHARSALAVPRQPSNSSVKRTVTFGYED